MTNRYPVFSTYFLSLLFIPYFFLPRFFVWLFRRQHFLLSQNNIYHQIKIKEGDVSKTTFQTRYDQYEFVVISFGLTNALTLFMDLMNVVFKECINTFFYRVHTRYSSILKKRSRAPRTLEREQFLRQILEIRTLATTSLVVWTRCSKRLNFSRFHQD